MLSFRADIKIIEIIIVGRKCLMISFCLIIHDLNDSDNFSSFQEFSDFVVG